MSVEEEALLTFIRQWHGIRVYPNLPDPNQQRLAAACIALVEQGRLASRQDGEALLVWVPSPNCPSCGYPDKAEGGPFKGIYTPGKPCDSCGFVEAER